MVDKQAFSMCGQYQLDVDVNTVAFWHHHLFSQEHVHASQLARLYEDYVSRMRKRTVEFLTGKVATLVLVYIVTTAASWQSVLIRLFCLF